jgi:hypothetical protein
MPPSKEALKAAHKHVNVLVACECHRTKVEDGIRIDKWCWKCTELAEAFDAFAEPWMRLAHDLDGAIHLEYGKESEDYEKFIAFERKEMKKAAEREARKKTKKEAPDEDRDDPQGDEPGDDVWPGY